MVRAVAAPIGPDLTSDLDVLAATIYGECRGETLAGKQAVAAVVMNRAAYAAANRYPEFCSGTVRSACLAPWQFSCWNDNDPNRADIDSLDFSNPDAELTECLQVAHDALNGSLMDPTGGCLFYKTTSLPWPKDWGKKVAADIVIGRQSFYRLGLTMPEVAKPVLPVQTTAPQEVDADGPRTFWQRLKAWFA